MKKQFSLFNHSLFEAVDTKTKTQTKTPFGFDPDVDLTSRPKNTPTVSEPKQDTKSDTGQPKQSARPKQKTASASKTSQATSGIDLGRQGMRHMMDLMHNQDQIDISNEPELDLDTDVDQDVEPTYDIMEPIETTPDTLPAVINKEILAGYDVEPEWHMVKNLPGYLSTPIRALGRQIFNVFTTTPIEDINVVANLMGQGPNETIELNAVSSFIKKNGTRNTDAEIEIEALMPGYGADVSVFDAKGYTFMLVEDFAGRYIYSWPTDTNLTGISDFSHLR